jgi:phospholipase/carboxylesterase
MAHGRHDDIVRYEWGERSKDAHEAGGWHDHWHAYTMAHNATLEEIEDLGRFIARVLAPGR